MSVVLNRMRDARNAASPPVAPHYTVTIRDDERRRLAELAGRIAAEERALAAVPILDPLLGVGALSAPSLLIEDHSGILHARASGADVIYKYRALVLAGEGDMLAVGGPRNPAFESYCRDFLKLGRVAVLCPAAGGPDRPLALACAEDAGLVERAAREARGAGALNVVPYMATGGTWLLAGRIARRARVPIRLAGSPPNLTRQVNNKIWFARRVREALGQNAVPPSQAVYGIVGLVGHLRRLCRSYEFVAVKLTHSAASRGNLVLDSTEVAGLSPAAMRARLEQLMCMSGWEPRFPMQVTAWEVPLLASPSVQLWIPLAGAGDPVVEGVFDQIVCGRVARFSGAEPCQLPDRWKQRIALEAALLGTLFQQLGYFGRCSFDAVVAGGESGDAKLHWVECNGRWGGVSIPMTLANRVRGDWSAGGFKVASPGTEGFGATDAAQFLQRFDDALYRPGLHSAGAILLSPGRLQAGLGIDLLILGADAADVRRRSDSLLARLADHPRGPMNVAPSHGGGNERFVSAG